uniref:Protein polybromo-1 n=1 Tax=Plectus sambesii TaxID=2011161 RepID=A0A914WAV1_9BILA
MSKRRKDSDVDGVGPSSSKRSRRSTAIPSLDQMRLCQDLFDSIRSYKTPENHLLCEAFIRAPSRRNAPEYYKAVKQPIDLTRIQQKVKTDEYESFEAFCADIAILIDNAKSFYKKTDQEYKDACDLWTFFVEKKAKLLDSGDESGKASSKETSPAPSVRSIRSNSPSRSVRSKDASPGRFSVAGNDPVDSSVLEDLLASILELTDDTGRLLSPPFRVLMSPEEYPEYYETIKEPIDLKTIAQKIRENQYRTLNDIERDLCILCKNAKIFNEPSAVIHKDANVIRKFLAKRKLELLDQAMRPIEKQKAARNAEIIDELLKQSTSDDGDAEYSEDSDEDEASERSPDPKWILYWSVRNYAHPHNPGTTLAEFFCQLPSRNWYPDYYDEVSEPMSLFLINKKLKRNQYESLAQLVDDLNTMLNNARSYNIEGSDIYENACRLQAVANRKAKELDPNIDITQYGSADLLVPDDFKREASTPGAGSVSSSTTPQPHSSHRRSRASAGGENRGKPGRKTLDELMQRYKDKLTLAWNAVHNYKENGRWVAEMFVSLPSKKLYPDYYKVIPEPIDMTMIKENIIADKYESSEQLAADFDLMFGNARHFNEESSIIYRDAGILEQVFRSALKGLGPMSLESPKILKEKFGTLPVMQTNLSPLKAKLLHSWTAPEGFDEMRKPMVIETASPCPPSIGMDSGNIGALSVKQEQLTACRSASSYDDSNLVNSWKPTDMPQTSSSLEDRKSRKKSRSRASAPILTLASSDDCAVTSDAYRSSVESWKPVRAQAASRCVDSPATTSDAACASSPVETPLNSPEFVEKRRRHPPAVYDPSEQLLIELQRKLLLKKVWEEQSPLSPPTQPRKRGRPPMRHQPIVWKWSKTRLPGGPNLKILRQAGGNRPATTASPASQSPGAAGASPADASGNTPRRPPQMTVEQQRMWSLYSVVKECKDARGRQLSQAFLKLPSRNEYPDYYEVIRKPMDLSKIGNRMATGYYESLDSLFQDFILMFDNACRYNEPESVVYKDALSLQKVLLQKRAELGAEQTSTVPNVQASVQDLLINLFITVNNHQDVDGRCYSDSLAEFHELIKKSGGGHPPLTFDQIKSYLDKGRYRRLDRFQDDVFEILEKARELSRSDSQLFEDALELQAHFIRTRDELCKNLLISPARYYTERHLLSSAEALRKQKQPKETDDDSASKDQKQSLGEKRDGDELLESVEHGGEEYAIGDFVYIEPTAENAQAQPHIMRVERLWKDSDGHELVRGRWFYRPNETFHLATRKFMVKEVFLTPYFDTVTVDRLLGKCFVMFVRDYLKFRPKSIDDSRVYVCESRYLGRQLHFKKMKTWPYTREEDGIDLEERPEPLTPIRVASAFVNPGDQPGPATTEPKSEPKTASVEEPVEGSPLQPLLHKEREEVPLAEQTSTDGRTFFEQLCYNGVWLQLGQAAYVHKPEKEQPDIVRIDRLWRNQNGDAFVSGAWFARPSEIDHEPSRMFYKREVFGTEQPDMVVPLSNVKGLCIVYTLKDFCSMRPTELREQDVYVVQYKVLGKQPAMGQCTLTHSSSSALSAQEDGANEVQSPPPINGQPMSESSARKLKAMKTYKLSEKVLEDEIFLFKKPINPEKEMSPLLMKTDTSVDVDALSSADLDEAVSESNEPSDVMGMSTKELSTWLAAQPKLNSRSKSGYILFSAEIRKRIMQENPEATFGEISKKVGVEWKKLTEDEKKQYEVRAQYIAEEREKADALQPPASARLQPGQIRVHCCKWQGCDYQFDTQDILYEHIKTMHTSQIMEGENQYVCLWMSCLKYRKDGKPFPSLPRLHRHIKEKHLSGAAKCIFQNQKTKNYTGTQSAAPPASSTTPQPPATPGYQHGGQATPAHGGYLQQTPQGSPYQHPPGTAPPTPYGAPYGQPMQPGMVAVDAHGHPIPIQQHPHQPAPYPPGAPMPSHMQPPPPPPQGYPQPVGGPVGQPGPMGGHQQQPTQMAYAAGDPGKVVVQGRPAEPVFVAPPSSQHVSRVVHSEIYLRYIESLGDDRQQSVSKWDRALNAGPRNTPLPPNRTPPVHWFAGAKAREEDLIKALWSLRDHMLEHTINVARDLDASEW